MAQKFLSPPVSLTSPGWNAVPASTVVQPVTPPKLAPLFPTTSFGEDDKLFSVLSKSDPQFFNGMAFQFGGTVLSTFAPKSDDDVIRTSIEMILLTLPGERVMRPDFGSNLQNMVFEPSDEFLAIMLRTEVEEALAQWENRAEIGLSEIETNDDRVIIRVPIALPRADEVRSVNFGIELERETLYNIPFRR
jgi:phage baseplate assembly protein W